MVYIAFLKGINVGGKNIIKMSDLKLMFANMGISDAITYIQSGNILFTSDDTEEALVKKIEASIFKTFGLNIAVILRTLSELRQLLNCIPFSENDIQEIEQNAEGEVFYLFLYREALSESSKERISARKQENDRLEIINRDVYVLFDKTIRNSKLANALQKADEYCTSRNIKTINKLVELGTNNFI